VESQPANASSESASSTVQGPQSCLERTQKTASDLHALSCAPEEYNPNKFYTPEDPFMMPIPYGPCLFTGMPFLPKNIINKDKWEAIKERCLKLGITERMLEIMFQHLCSPLDEALGTVKLKRFFGQFAAENRRLLKAMVMDIAKGKQRVYFEDAVMILAEFCALDFVSLVYKFVKVVAGDEGVHHMSVDLMRGLLRYLWDNKVDNFNKLLLRHTWSDHPHHGVQAFVDFSIRYPCVIFPLVILQRSVQRKILGRSFWEAFHNKQHTQLLPGGFGAEHARMVAARVVMLEAVSEVCRPFQFGTPLTRSDPPPPTPRTLDPRQWDFAKLPKDTPTPLRRAMSTTQFTRSSSSRLAGPAALMRSNTAGRGELNAQRPGSRGSISDRHTGSAPAVFAGASDGDSDSDSSEPDEALAMQEHALAQSRGSTAVLDMHHVQLGKRAGGETSTGQQVLPRRVRKLGGAAQAELGYVDPFQAAHAPDAGLEEIKNMEKSGLSGADMAKEEREALKRTEAVAAKLKEYISDEGVLDVTKPGIEILKEILEDANLAADMSDYDKAKIIAAIHEKDQQALGLSRVYFSLANPSAYAAAAFAFSYYLSMQHRKEKQLRQGLVSYSLPTAAVAPTKAAYAKTHPAPHGARCVKNSMDIAQLVIVHATSGLGTEPTVVQAPCLFTGAMVASQKQVVRPPTVEELAGDTSKPDRNFGAPAARDSGSAKEPNVDLGASVFSPEATGGTSAKAPSAETVDSDRALRMLKEGALHPAEGHQVIRRLKGEALYLPSASKAGSRFAELVDADPSLGEFEALEKVRLREQMRRGELSKDIVWKFPMLVGAPPIKFKRPEVNNIILARRCSHWCSRQAAYMQGCCQHGWIHRQENWEWCKAGGCTQACGTCLSVRGEVIQRTCVKCGKRTKLKCSVWYALTLGRVQNCLGALGAALCELGRSCVFLSKELITDCCLTAGATCENCCCRTRQIKPKRVQPGATAESDDPDAALRREVAALDKHQDIEKAVDSKRAASFGQPRDGSNFSDRRRQREIARVRRKMPRGGFVAPAPRGWAAADKADSDEDPASVIALPRRLKKAKAVAAVGDPKVPPEEPHPHPPSAAGNAKAADMQEEVGDTGAGAGGPGDVWATHGGRVRVSDSPDGPLARITGSPATPTAGAMSPTSPMSTGSRKRRASERALLRIDTSADLAAQRAKAECQAAVEASIEAARMTEEQADRQALAALSRSVSVLTMGTPAFTSMAGGAPSTGRLSHRDDLVSSDDEQQPKTLQRQPSQIDMASAALGEALGGLDLDLAQTSVHTVVDPHNTTAVLDLGAVSAARQRAEYRKVNPKAKPRGALYPATKLLQAASVPSAQDLPEKKFNTGFCAEADFFIYHVLADLYGYKVATAIAEASAAPQSNDVIIAQHEVAARTTGQSLVKFHRDGERNGYMFHDDVWVELYDEDAESFFYHNLATGTSLPFGQAPPAYKEFIPTGE